MTGMSFPALASIPVVLVLLSPWIAQRFLDRRQSGVRLEVAVAQRSARMATPARTSAPTRRLPVAPSAAADDAHSPLVHDRAA